MSDRESVPAALEPAAPTDLESRQDEVLRQLSDLLQRLELTIREAQGDRARVAKRPAA